MRMSDLSQGDRARIVSIEGGHGFREKLHHRGLAEGRTVTVISNNNGPVVIEINRATMAVGRGMAQKIAVKRLVGR